MSVTGLIRIGIEVARYATRYGIKLGKQEDKFFGQFSRGLPREQQRAFRHARYISQSVGLTKGFYPGEPLGNEFPTPSEPRKKAYPQRKAYRRLPGRGSSRYKRNQSYNDRRRCACPRERY